MKKILCLALVLVLLVLAGCQGAPGIAGPPGAVGSTGPAGPAGPAGSSGVGLTLVSSAFVDGGIIPVKHTGAGGNVSPAIQWRGVPVGTQSFAIIMTDPDFPWGQTVPVYGKMPPPGTMAGDIFAHWIVVNIPVGVNSLNEGASPKAMPAGILEAKSSLAAFGTPGNQYGGPAPPPGMQAHKYHFTLYALNVATLPGVTATSDFAAVTQAMAGKVLATASLTGHYGQK